MFEPAIVIDNGSEVLRCGWAGDDKPRVSISNVVGRPRFPMAMYGAGAKDSYVCSEAQSKRGLLTLKYPVKNGIVTDWDDMEKIWYWMFDAEIRAAPESHPVLITEPILNPKANREKMMQIMFESFCVPAFSAADPASLSIYEVGRLSGLVLSSGEGVTSVVPIYEGYVISQAVHRSDLAGQSVTEYLTRILTESGYYFTTTAEHEIVRDIKEKLGYVALDFEHELMKASCMVELQKEYEETLSSNTLKLSHERFRCTEAMFQPSFLGKESLGVHELVYNAIMKSDIDTRKELWQNIVLSGGNTMFPGFAERLQKELRKLAPDGVNNINIRAGPDRNDLAWVGGSILASLGSFEEKWITKNQYDEIGPSVFHRVEF